MREDREPDRAQGEGLLSLPVTTLQRVEIAATHVAQIVALAVGFTALPLVLLTGQLLPVLVVSAWCLIAAAIFFGTGVGAVTSLDESGITIETLRDTVIPCPFRETRRIVNWTQWNHLADYGGLLLVCKRPCAGRRIWFASVSRFSEVKPYLKARGYEIE